MPYEPHEEPGNSVAAQDAAGSSEADHVGPIVQTSIQHTGSFRSPLLPPNVLEDYATVIDNAPERFMAMLEAENANQRLLERWITIGPILIIPLVIGAGVYLGGWPGGAVISVVTAIGAWVIRAPGKRD